MPGVFSGVINKWRYLPQREGWRGGARTVLIACTMMLITGLLSTPAMAVCPTTSLTVTTATSISGCTITDLQVTVSMGSCTGCAFEFENNVVTNVGTPKIAIYVVSFSTGGSITIRNNVFKSTGWIVYFNPTVLLTSVPVLVFNNQAEFTLSETNYYFFVSLPGTTLTGSTTVDISKNSLTYTGSLSILIGVVVVQYTPTSTSSTSVVITVNDNVNDISGIHLSGFAMDSGKAYGDESVPFIHAIIFNFHATVAAANYPTVVVQRNTIRSASTGPSWPKLFPNVVRLNDQTSSTHDLTITDNLIDVDCALSPTAAIVSHILEFTSHAVGGTLTVQNNRIQVANVKGLLHQIFSNIILAEGLSLNGGATISNNSILVTDLSSALNTVRSLQFESSVIGVNIPDVSFVSGDTGSATPYITIGMGSTLSIFNNTNEARRVSLWRRSSTYTGIPYAIHSMILATQLSVLDGSSVSIHSNTLNVESAYVGVTTDNGVTFTAASPSVDSAHFVLGQGGIVTSSLSSSTVFIDYNHVSAVSSNFRNVWSVIALSENSSNTLGISNLSIASNTVEVNQTDVSGTAYTGIIYSIVQWTSASTVALSSNAVSVNDISVASSNAAVTFFLGSLSATLSTTCSFSLMGNIIHHTITRPTLTTTSLLSLTGTVSLALSGALNVADNAVSLIVSSDGDEDFAYLDAILVAQGSAASSAIHAIVLGDTSSLTVNGAAIVNITTTSISVTGEIPRPALSSTLFDTALTTTISIAGTVSVSTSYVSVILPLYCRLWGGLVVGGQRLMGSVSLIGPTGSLLLNGTSVTLTAIDNTSIPNPAGYDATCANKSTTTAFAMAVSSFEGSGGGEITCSSNSVGVVLGGRGYLRGTSQVVDLTLTTGSPTVSITNNTIHTTTDTPLLTLDTAAMMASFTITPVTLCGGKGILSIKLSSAVSSYSPSTTMITIANNTIESEATEEAWGTCSMMWVMFDSTPQPSDGKLTDISANTVQLTSNRSDSLSSGLKVVSLSGIVVSPATGSTDFAAVRDNRFQRVMLSVVDALEAQIPSLIAPVVTTVTSTSPLTWWACTNEIRLIRMDGNGVNVSRSLATYKDIEYTCKYDPVYASPSHCRTLTPSVSVTGSVSLSNLTMPMTVTTSIDVTATKSSAVSASMTIPPPTTASIFSSASESASHTSSQSASESGTASMIGTSTASPAHSQTPDLTSTVGPPPTLSATIQVTAATATNNNTTTAAGLLDSLPLFSTVTVSDGTIRAGVDIVIQLTNVSNALWELLSPVGGVLAITSTTPQLGGRSVSNNQEGFFLEVPVAVGVRMINATHIAVTTTPLPQYTIYDDERLQLFTTLRGTLGATTPLADMPHLVGTIVSLTSEPGPSPSVVAVTTTVVAGSGLLGLAAELQGVTAMALLGCADPATHHNFGSFRVLSPVAVFDSYAGVILGNAALALLVCVLQVCVLAVLRCLYGVRRTIDLMSTARFPALTIMATLAFQTGTAFSSAQLISQPSRYAMWEVAVGAVAFIISVLLPVALSLHPFLRVGRAYQTYANSEWFTAQSLSPKWAFVVPQGSIFPINVRQAYGSYITSVRAPPGQMVWTSLPSWSCVVFLITGLFHPTTVLGCRLLLICVGIAFFVLAAIVVWVRPLRSPLAACLDASSRVCLGCTLFCMSAAVTSNVTASWAIVGFTILLLVTVLLRGTLAVVNFFFDRRMAHDTVLLSIDWVHILGSDKKVTQQFSTTDDELLFLATHRDMAEPPNINGNLPDEGIVMLEMPLVERDDSNSILRTPPTAKNSSESITNSISEEEETEELHHVVAKGGEKENTSDTTDDSFSSSSLEDEEEERSDTHSSSSPVTVDLASSSITTPQPSSSSSLSSLLSSPIEDL